MYSNQKLIVTYAIQEENSIVLVMLGSGAVWFRRSCRR